VTDERADDRRAVLLTILDRALGEHATKSTIDVGQAAVVLGISRGLAYELVRRDELPAVRVGHRLRVPVPALAAVLSAHRMSQCPTNKGEQHDQRHHREPEGKQRSPLGPIGNGQHHDRSHQRDNELHHAFSE
jgi:excisionase family DNA binding protein